MARRGAVPTARPTEQGEGPHLAGRGMGQATSASSEVGTRNHWPPHPWAGGKPVAVAIGGRCSHGCLCQAEAERTAGRGSGSSPPPPCTTESRSDPGGHVTKPPARDIRVPAVSRGLSVQFAMLLCTV